MLRSFRVANHKSIRDEAELLMLPAYDKTRPTTPVAAIFGANASGKSNLLDALRWMQAAVRESYARWEPGAGVPRTPFRLDPEAAARPSLYCVEVVIDGARYTYGVEVDDERVHEEWLYTYPHSRRRVIFERDQDTIRLGSTVPDHRARGEQLERQTRSNALFLSVAAHNDLAEVQPVYQWFRSGVRYSDSHKLVDEELVRRLSEADQRPSVVALIGAADLGITDVTIEDDSELTALEAQIAEARQTYQRAEERLQHLEAQMMSEASNLEASRAEVLEFARSRSGATAEQVDEFERNLVSQERLRARLEQITADVAVQHNEIRMLHDLLERRHQTSTKPRLRFHHGKSLTPLTLDEQSAGTRNWIEIVSTALDVIGFGGLLIVDEVDASLHPHLTSRLINLFRDTETNPGDAQLLLTTHDATLLDEETLSRDEIWFVEKEPDSGATRLYSLTDFHPRKNENTEGRYLAGSYGAIPVLAEYRFRKALRPGEARDAAA